METEDQMDQMELRERQANLVTQVQMEIAETQDLQVPKDLMAGRDLQDLVELMATLVELVLEDLLGVLVCYY